MARRNTRPIYHENDPYAKGNAIEGDKIAAILNRWIDHDIQWCLFGLLIVTHWASPTKERGTYKGKRVIRPYRVIPIAKVLGMVLMGKYRIRRPETVMRDAKALGVPGIEWEWKFTPSQKQAQNLATVAEKVWGPNWRRHNEVKMLAQFNWGLGLSRSKRVGFITTIINFNGDPARLPSYVDKYRPGGKR